MQCEESDDRMQKAYVFAGVLGVALGAVLVYAVVKNIINNNK